MPITVKLWTERSNGELTELKSGHVSSEQQLEEWIKKDAGILADDLLVIGQQLPSPLGGVLDLLCIDSVGDLVIVELKKDRTARDVVSQALHYAAWVSGLSRDDVEGIARNHIGRGLEEAFRERFETSLPDEINENHRIVIVASKLDPVSETITEYLSEHWSVDINAMFFSCFKDAEGRMLLARSWLMEPAQVEQRTIAGPEQKPKRSLEELAEAAEANGVRQVFEVLCNDLGPLVDVRETTRNNVTFIGAFEGSRLALLSAYPGWSSSAENGLRCDVRPDRLAAYLRLDEKQIRQALPPRSEPDGYYVFDELYHLKGVDAAERVVELFRRANGNGGGRR